MTVLARVVIGHDDSLDYHEWAQVGRAKINSRCVSNPRMIFTTGSKHRCNNPDCPAWGFVHDKALAVLLNEAEESL